MRGFPLGTVFQKAPFDRTGVTGWDRMLTHFQTLKAGLECKLGLAFFHERISQMGVAIDEVGVTIDQRLQCLEVLCRRERPAIALLKRLIQFLDEAIIFTAMTEEPTVAKDSSVSILCLLPGLRTYVCFDQPCVVIVTLAAGGCGRSRWMGRLLSIFRGTSRRLTHSVIGFVHNHTIQRPVPRRNLR